MRHLFELIADRFPWLTPRRAIIGFFTLALLVVLLLPNAHLVVQFVTIATLVGTASAILSALTFWQKARVQIGRMNFRYKRVRRNAGAVAVLGFSFLVVQGIGLGLRNSSEPVSGGGSPPPASTSPAKPGTSPAATLPVASHEAEMEDARKFMCAFGESDSGDGGLKLTKAEDRSTLAGAAAAHLQEFFHVSHEDASEVATEVEKEASTTEFRCPEILKRNPLKQEWPEYAARDHTEALRAATIFCREFSSLLKPGETVRDSEYPLLSGPCNIDNGEIAYCPNGMRLEPSKTIAEQFKIPWQQANADIVAGLANFDPKSPIADACVELARQDPSESGALEQQQTLDARLALCVAAEDEYQDVVLGKSHKDAIILANQSAVGERAGGDAIGREWGAYEAGEWHDSQCYDLSVAPWAKDEGYFGDPIHLADGAIKLVVKSDGWLPPESDLPHNPEGTIGKSDTK